MSAYSIQRDAPSIAAANLQAPAALVYGEDFSWPRGQPSYQPAFHAHSQPIVKDNGPPLRNSRLPLFKHVKSMLQKPPAITTPSQPKWDEYTGELSDSGHPPKAKPSAYVSPYDGAFKSSRKRSPQRLAKSRRNRSPVSVLNDDELTPVENLVPVTPSQDERSPVSPISAPSQVGDEYDDEAHVDPSLLPEPLSANIQRVVPPGPRTPTSSQPIKRKPVSRDFSSGEKYPPPHSPSQSSDTSADYEEANEGEATRSRSHFSWTTYADSVVPAGRASIDTVATHQAGGSPEMPRSRFSWSTVATNMTQQSPPRNAPPPPTQFSTSPPVQSILSRRRPVQRADQEEWSPVTASTRLANKAPPTSLNPFSTPTSACTVKPLALQIRKPQTPSTTTSSTPTSTRSTSKALPPPPQLSGPDNDLTHLEILLTQERDTVLQRRNVERAIQELEKTEKASPLEVSFATVKDAKKRLVEYRTRLDEVRLEEREIGIAIARTRRREEKETGGDGETLWVRRVTG